MELVSKVFLTSHLDILEKSEECWSIVLGIIGKLKENKSDEICEVIKNILFVLIYEKKLVEGTEQWKETWKVIEGLLHEVDFVEKKEVKEEVKVEEKKEEPVKVTEPEKTPEGFKIIRKKSEIKIHKKALKAESPLSE